jgi:Flp pilus assembly protein TadB
MASVYHRHIEVNWYTINAMALFVNQQNERTELQKRIAAELAEKAKKKSLENNSERPDGVTDSAYLEKTKTTTSLAWVWILIVIATVAALIWLVVASR